MNGWDKFQMEAMKTCPDTMSTEEMIMHARMGMVGEAGEVVDALKKWRFQSTKDAPMPKGKVVEECGDMMWYCAELCTASGVPLSVIRRYRGIKVRDSFIKMDICEKSMLIAKMAMLMNVDEPFGLYPQLPRLMMHVGVLLDEVGSSTEEAMNMVIEKLRMRYPKGFEAKRSMEREKHHDTERVSEQYRALES